MSDPHVALMSFRDVMDANDPVLLPLFDRLEEDYRTGTMAQRKWDEQIDRVKSRPGLMWERW